MKQFFTNIVLKRSRMVSDGPNSFRRVTEEVTCRVDVTIDTERLFLALGTKALGNKTRKAGISGGMIVAKVTEAK